MHTDALRLQRHPGKETRIDGNPNTADTRYTTSKLAFCLLHRFTHHQVAYLLFGNLGRDLPRCSVAEHNRFFTGFPCTSSTRTCWASQAFARCCTCGSRVAFSLAISLGVTVVAFPTPPLVKGSGLVTLKFTCVLGGLAFLILSRLWLSLGITVMLLIGTLPSVP